MILAAVNLYSLLQYLGLAISRKAEPLAILCPHLGEAMQDIECELLRIHLPRTRVNKRPASSQGCFAFSKIHTMKGLLSSKYSLRP